MGREATRLEAQDLTALVKRLKAESRDVAHVGIFDLNASFRERRFRVDDLAEALGSGGSFVNVVHQWDTGERVYGAGPFVGEPIAIDPESLRPYPFEPNACALVADYVGPSADVSPRRLLERFVARARDRGLGVRAAFEFEFLMLDEDAESLRETGFGTLKTFARDNRCWAGERAAIHAELVASLEHALIQGETDLLALGLELGPGCFEATLSHAEPLRVADNAAFFKLFTKAFCRRQGKTASFMAQLGGDFPGLSGHIHLSLTDRETGEDLFPDALDERGMSQAFRSFVAGLVALAPEAMPLTHTPPTPTAATRRRTGRRSRPPGPCRTTPLLSALSHNRRSDAGSSIGFRAPTSIPSLPWPLCWARVSGAWTRAPNSRRN